MGSKTARATTYAKQQQEKEKAKEEKAKAEREEAEEKKWQQQVREEVFRARCVLAKALRDDEAAYGGVELLMATEVRRKRRRVAGELERMVGRRFGYQKDLKAPATAAQTVWRVEAVEEDEEGEERVWALDTARYTTAVEELEERCECFTKEVLDKVRWQLRRQAVGPSRWRMKRTTTR